MKLCRHERDNIQGKQIAYAIPMLVILAENSFQVVCFNLSNSIFRLGFGVRLDCTDIRYLNCILVETTLCDIIFMHYVLNVIYQLYGEDTASILTY